jgi:hypothetical protein
MMMLILSLCVLLLIEQLVATVKLHQVQHFPAATSSPTFSKQQEAKETFPQNVNNEKSSKTFLLSAFVSVSNSSHTARDEKCNSTIKL